MRCRSVAVLLLAASVGCGDDEPDPLDRELLRELSLAQGTASGSARSGSFTLEFSTDSCDCPSVAIDGQSYDICTLARLADAEAQASEGSGVLAITPGNQVTLDVLTGAIESDGRFDIAQIHDATALIGKLEALRRMAGEFSDENTAAGWAGQRLIGELVDQPVDCRWIGSFVMTRH